MSRVLSLPFETQARILDRVRRVELILLLLTGALFGFYYQPWGAFLSLPMLATAVILVPRERALPAATREQMRFSFLEKATTEATDLQARYLEIRGRPLSATRSHAQKQVRRQIKLWMEAADVRFDAYPEFAAIFRAHDRRGGLIAELDACLQRLDELQRLCVLSKRLKLPI
jgi:hypothetical protein